MAGKKTTTKSDGAVDALPRARLHRLKISNFRAIGSNPVDIELDDIVVLVGANNTGKSSVLRAYQVVMESGKAGDLAIEDFPGAVLPSKEEGAPTIELETVLYPDSAPPASKWISQKPNGDRHVRERWRWLAPGAPTKRGFNTELGDWDPEHGPWGAAGVAQANRPAPHRIEAFDNPQGQAEAIVGLLEQAIKERVKGLPQREAGANESNDYASLLNSVKSLQRIVAQEALNAVEEVRKELGTAVSQVFPGFSITLDARPEDDVEKSISLFRAQPTLKMGPSGGHQSDLSRQGSGARRTLMWNALKILADRKKQEDIGAKVQRPQVLLLDEPELCLHPSAVRQACEVLYSLPKAGGWQVMVTTHSPTFIDLSRDNTSVIRVERESSGLVSGTTIYRPAKAELSDDDKERLKLLNMYDPYVAEFFFGGRTIVVEGDTEFSAFREVISEFPQKYQEVHLVRARGKFTIVSLCKVLNQFDCPYAVLHDADTQRIKTRKGVVRANSAWAANMKIAEEVGRNSRGVRLVASIHNFENAMFDGAADDEKPYNAWLAVRGNSQARARVVQLLDYLAGFGETHPDTVCPWSSEEELANAVSHLEP